jgi:hypothetical protein
MTKTITCTVLQNHRIKSEFKNNSTMQRYLELIWASHGHNTCLWDSLFFYHKNNKECISGIRYFLIGTTGISYSGNNI